MKNPKILLAPMNLANMPIQIVNSLREKGYIAEHIQYTFGQGHKFQYDLDREINLKELGGRIKAHSSVLREYIERDFDIFHFWNRSLFYNADYTHNTGFDIPLLKARKKKILFRFSGFDVRLPSKDKKVNPYSPFNYGYTHKFDEKSQQKFLDFLEEYVDQFLVQDPELQQFCPKAKIIPRALNLKDWKNIGIEKSDVPLIVHAPSDPLCKGTNFILKAVEDLKEEGLNFEFKLISGLTHKEAIEYYQKSDIVIDQILIGATGVLSLEAMALGKPVIVYLREDLFKPFYGGELPGINANPENIKEVIRNTVKDYDKRKFYSELGRATVEKHHDIDKVIDQYIDIYEKVLKSPATEPTSTRDIDYLEFQAESTQRIEMVSRANKKKFEDVRDGKYNLALYQLRSAKKDNLEQDSSNNRASDFVPALFDVFLPKEDYETAVKRMSPRLKLAVLSLYLPKFVVSWIKKSRKYQRALNKYESKFN